MFHSSVSFGGGISNDPRESLIYAADNLAQFTRADDQVASKCDRALPAARPHDIVVLRSRPDSDYLDWLSSFGLGTDHIVVYGCRDKPLSQLIVENPEPVREQIRLINKPPVYVPWFSGDMENRAARCIGADLFGASASLTWKYNNKADFKSFCRSLDIPVVEDTLVDIRPEAPGNRDRFEQAIEEYLCQWDTVLIRSTLDDAGVSLVFKTQENQVRELYDKLVFHRVEQILVEPFLDVCSSPNDQWIITRKGKIHHMGKRDQTCENGTHHVATLKVPEPESPPLRRIREISRIIVDEMAGSGYVGVVGIDYITTASHEIFPVENNARFNGSSYVSLIVEALSAKNGPIPCWKFMKVNTAPCSFNDMARRLSPILYDGVKTASVFPYNCDTLSTNGTFSVIILATDPGGIKDVESGLTKTGIC